MTAPDQDKRQIIETFLARGANLFIQLDPRHPDAQVPAKFRTEFILTLEIGYNMAIPIPDLDIADDGIGATLSFNRQPHWVFVPWAALFAAKGALGSALWPSSVPVELRPGAAAPVAPAGGVVIDLMSRRAPKDQRAVRARLAKLTAPGAPRGGSAA